MNFDVFPYKPDINKCGHEVSFIWLNYSLSSRYNFDLLDQTGLTIPDIKVMVVVLESIIVKNSMQMIKMSCFKLPVDLFLFCSFFI